MAKEPSARAAGLAGHVEGTPSNDARTDRELLDNFVQREDEAAFAAMVRRHGPMVLRVCRRVLHQNVDSEDAFQATFLVLARKAAHIKQPELLANWLYGVAYRTAQHARERNERRHQREREAASMQTPRTELGSSLNYLNELERLLDEELHRLPEKYRLPLVLCYLEGKTNKEAAQMLGWPSGSMSHRLERGRDLLRERLCSRLGASPFAITPLMLIDAMRSVEVSPLFLATTVQAGVALGCLKSAATSFISASVLELMEATLRSGGRSRLWSLGLILLILFSFGIAVGIAAVDPCRPQIPEPNFTQPASTSQPALNGNQQDGGTTDICPSQHGNH